MTISSFIAAATPAASLALPGGAIGKPIHITAPAEIALATDER